MANISLREYHEELNALLEHDALEEVIGHCRHILTYYPKNIETYRLLGKALLNKPRYHEAGDVFLRVLSVHPNDLHAHAAMSAYYRNSRDLSRAIWHMERAFEQSPHNAAIQDELRELYNLFDENDNGQYGKLQLTRGALARMYINTGLYEKAISELQHAINAHPDRVDLKALLAEAYWESGAEVEAAEVAADVIAARPYCLSANRIIASLWLAKNRPSDARPFLFRVEELDPYLAAELVNQQVGYDDPFKVERLDWSVAAAREVAGEAPDWMRQIGDVLERPQEVRLAGPAVTDEEVPDWFADVAPEPGGAAPSVEDALNFDMADYGGKTPDWMAEFEEPAGLAADDLLDFEEDEATEQPIRAAWLPEDAADEWANIQGALGDAEEVSLEAPKPDEFGFLKDIEAVSDDVGPVDHVSEPPVLEGIEWDLEADQEAAAAEPDLESLPEETTIRFSAAAEIPDFEDLGLDEPEEDLPFEEIEESGPDWIADVQAAAIEAAPQTGELDWEDAEIPESEAEEPEWTAEEADVSPEEWLRAPSMEDEIPELEEEPEDDYVPIEPGDRIPTGFTSLLGGIISSQDALGHLSTPATDGTQEAADEVDDELSAWRDEQAQDEEFFVKQTADTQPVPAPEDTVASDWIAEEDEEIETRPVEAVEPSDQDALDWLEEQAGTDDLTDALARALTEESAEAQADEDALDWLLESELEEVAEDEEEADVALEPAALDPLAWLDEDDTDDESLLAELEETLPVEVPEDEASLDWAEAPVDEALAETMPADLEEALEEEETHKWRSQAPDDKAPEEEPVAADALAWLEADTPDDEALLAEYDETLAVEAPEDEADLSWAADSSDEQIVAQALTETVPADPVDAPSDEIEPEDEIIVPQDEPIEDALESLPEDEPSAIPEAESAEAGDEEEVRWLDEEQIDDEALVEALQETIPAEAVAAPVAEEVAGAPDAEDDPLAWLSAVEQAEQEANLEEPKPLSETLRQTAMLVWRGAGKDGEKAGVSDDEELPQPAAEVEDDPLAWMEQDESDLEPELEEEDTTYDTLPLNGKDDAEKEAIQEAYAEAIEEIEAQQEAPSIAEEAVQPALELPEIPEEEEEALAWMQEAATEEMLEEELEVPVDGGLDWLNQPEPEDEDESEMDLMQDEDDPLAWLHADLPEEEPVEADSVADVLEDLTAETDEDSSMVPSQPEPDESDLPELPLDSWQSEVGDTPSDAAELPDDEPEQDEVPEWLQEEPAEDSWLNTVVEDGPKLKQTGKLEGGPPEADGVTEWLSQMGGFPTRTSDLELPPEETPKTATLLEWFNQMGLEGTPRKPEVEMSEEEAALSATPDWLSDLDSDEPGAELPVEDSTPEPADADLSDWTMETGESDEELPDLEDLFDSEDESDEAEESGVADMSEWMSELDEDEVEEEQPAAEMPDWMDELGEPGEEDLEEEEPVAAVAEDTELEPAEMPDWMSELGEPGEEDLQEEEPVAAVAEDAGIEPAEMPDWMSELGEPGEEVLEEEDPVAAVAEDAELEPAEMPDWMSELGEPGEEVLEEEEPVAAVAEDAELEPAEIPGWLSEATEAEAEKPAAVAEEPAEEPEVMELVETPEWTLEPGEPGAEDVLSTALEPAWLQDMGDFALEEDDDTLIAELEAAGLEPGDDEAWLSDMEELELDLESLEVAPEVEETAEPVSETSDAGALEYEAEEAAHVPEAAVEEPADDLAWQDEDLEALTLDLEEEPAVAEAVSEVQAEVVDEVSDVGALEFEAEEADHVPEAMSLEEAAAALGAIAEEAELSLQDWEIESVEAPGGPDASTEEETSQPEWLRDAYKLVEDDAGEIAEPLEPGDKPEWLRDAMPVEDIDEDLTDEAEEIGLLEEPLDLDEDLAELGELDGLVETPEDWTDDDIELDDMDDLEEDLESIDIDSTLGWLTEMGTLEAEPEEGLEPGETLPVAQDDIGPEWLKEVGALEPEMAHEVRFAFADWKPRWLRTTAGQAPVDDTPSWVDSDIEASWLLDEMDDDEFDLLDED